MCCSSAVVPPGFTALSQAQVQPPYAEHIETCLHFQNPRYHVLMLEEKSILCMNTSGWLSPKHFQRKINKHHFKKLFYTLSVSA